MNYLKKFDLKELSASVRRKIRGKYTVIQG